METKKENNYMEAAELGKFITTIRKEKQLTQAELARKLNVTDKAVSRWGTRTRFPRYQYLRASRRRPGNHLNPINEMFQRNRRKFR